MRTFPLLLTAAAALWGAGMNARQTLFVIERSTNANVVHYDAHLAPDGRLDASQPIDAYWVMAAADGHREELNGIERHRAYGFTIEPGSDSHSFRLQLVAQKQRTIDVYQDGPNVHAETIIAGRRAYLTKIYVNTGRLLAVPKVKSIELFGIDTGTGQPVHETVTP